MKSIICFTESLAGGGAEHQMALLAQFLKEEGYDVSIVTYADLPDHYEIPCTIRRIKLSEGRNKTIKLIHVFFYFLFIKTDCIISYRKMCNIRLLVPMFFRSRKIKVLCSERNTTIGSPDIARRIMVKYLYRRADYIIPNSFSQARVILGENPRLEYKLRTIHNYTDLLHFKPSNYPPDMDCLRLAVFARFSHQKNPFLFVDALSHLKKKTNRLFEVHWYGGREDDPFYLSVKDYVEDRYASDVFVMHSSVKDPSLLMPSFHAICLPSLYEGFSNSIAEAICCGKPMLVSDVADNGIMVRQGINGFLFDPNDIESICNSFLLFFSLPYDEKCRFARNSREIAESLFNKQEFLNNYIDLIES